MSANTDLENSISVWFVCKSCCEYTYPFRNVALFLEHKRQKHYEEFQKTKCIVFEEQKLDRDSTKPKPSIYQQTGFTIQEKSSLADDDGADSDADKDKQDTIFVDDPSTVLVITQNEFDYEQVEIQTEESSADPIDSDYLPDIGSESASDVDNIDDETEFRSVDAVKSQTRKQQEVIINCDPSSFSHTPEASSWKQSPLCNPNPYVLLKRLKLPKKHTSTLTESDPDFDLDLVQHSNLRLKSNSRKIRKALAIKSQKSATSGNNRKPHICPVCHKSFQYRCRYKLHFQLHTGSKPVKCIEPSCLKHFRENSEMKTHFRRVHGPKTETETETEGNIPVPRKRRRAHVVRSKVEPSEKTFMCEICGLSFAKNHILKSHLKITHDDARPFACPHPDCNMAFKTQSILSSHKRVHQDPDSRFKCHYTNCDKSFTTKYKLKMHLQTMSHTGMPPPKHLLCHIENCTKSFDKRRELNRHFITAHGMDGELPRLPCEHCGKIFNRKLTLTKHIMTHTGEQPFKCTFAGCNKAYTSITPFRDHERKHTGERPFMCDVCGKALRTKEIFKRHLRAAHPTVSVADTFIVSH